MPAGALEKQSKRATHRAAACCLRDLRSHSRSNVGSRAAPTGFRASRTMPRPGSLHAACHMWPSRPGAVAAAVRVPSASCISATEPSGAASSSESSAAKDKALAGPLMRTSPAGSHGAASRPAREKTAKLDSPGKATAARSTACFGWRPSASAPAKGRPARLMGSLAPASCRQRQRPSEGPRPGHSIVTPAAAVRRSPAVSQEAATKGPKAATPSSTNGLTSARPWALLTAAGITKAPRPWRDNVIAAGMPASAWPPACPHARIRGSKSAGHCTSRRVGDAASGAVNDGAPGTGAEGATEKLPALWPLASSRTYGRRSLSRAAISRRRAALTSLLREMRSDVRPSACRRRSTACSFMPTAGPASAPPVPTSTGSAAPGFAGRYRGSRALFGMPRALSMDG
mmetsp:Transcript_6122/g.19046  ORF Transcript_6122/g.19046 Transcript_6122/m.19046 type:complete len:400 (+) Transcript_6122:400-1599(+)